MAYTEIFTRNHPKNLARGAQSTPDSFRTLNPGTGACRGRAGAYR